MYGTSVITMVMFIMVIMLPISKSLVSLGSILLLCTLLFTVMISNFINSWFSFMMFLVLITGLLVLFSYMVAMSPNSFYVQKKSTVKMVVVLFLLSVLLTGVVLKPMKGEKSFEQDVQQMFNFNNTCVYWMMGVVLLLALLVAVSICYKSAKPLRNYL